MATYKVEAQENTFKTFEDLDAYKAAREFRVSMYAITRRLPEFEKFGLADQIRRAAVSLTNNIAEGHGRYHYLDQIRFMLQSRGSLEELIDDLNICEDEKYLPAAEISPLKAGAWRVHKILNGYIRFLRSRKSNEPYVLRDEKQTDGIFDDELNDGFNASTF
jgi:four helix bundle protein